MHATARQFIVFAQTALCSRIEALRLLGPALTIDLASTAVRAHIPGALLLVRNAIDLDAAQEFISNSAELGSAFTLPGYSDLDEDEEQIESFAASWFSDIRSADTYRFALFEDGVLRPVDSSVEDDVERLCGLRFRELLRLAQDSGLGATWRELDEDPERALRQLGWDALVRSQNAIDWDGSGRFHWKNGDATSSALYWMRRVLDWWGPSLLHVARLLRDVDPRVIDALSTVADGEITWDLDGLARIPALIEHAEADLLQARIDLLELDVRTLLDEHDIVGQPTGLIVARTDGTSGEDDDLLVPIRVMSGTLPLLDLVDVETETSAVIGDRTWRLLDNVLVDDLESVTPEHSVPVEGIDIGDMRLDPLIVDGRMFNGFRRVNFGPQN